MEQTKSNVSEGAEKAACHCPFCDNALEMPYPFCQACGAELEYCPVCGEPLPPDSDACPHCAAQEGE